MKKEKDFIERLFDENSTKEDYLIAFTSLLKGFTSAVLEHVERFESQIQDLKDCLQEVDKIIDLESPQEIEKYLDEKLKEKEITIKSHSFTVTPENKDKVLEQIVNEIRKDIKGKTIGEIEKSLNKKKN